MGPVDNSLCAFFPFFFPFSLLIPVDVMVLSGRGLVEMHYRNLCPVCRGTGISLRQSWSLEEEEGEEEEREGMGR